ncbi:hypothetical protein Srufu_046980 [Streptomyces libani subsp. rufus]|nr:hypothetical protein Srufu_046980 [Streptomyces libani subsp. rufus]
MGEEGVAGAAGRGVAAVLGVAVLADVACGEFGVFEGAAGFAVGEGFAGGAFAAVALDGGEVSGEQDGFGAASGETFALCGGEGVEEVLDEGVQGGGCSALLAVQVSVCPRTDRAAPMVGRMPSRRWRRAGAPSAVPLQPMRGSPAAELWWRAVVLMVVLSLPESPCSWGSPAVGGGGSACQMCWVLR